jgi:putative nucleotidyltransferase with HDIG domain
MASPQLVKPSFDVTLRKIVSVSTLPHVALKILDLTSDPESTAAQLESVIKGDPALTTRILKICNSAHFGLAERVLEVKKAVIFMGFKTVKDLALSASVCELFKNANLIGRYKRTDLWRHSVGVAITAKAIAERTNKDLQDYVFSTGILHDIGIVMLDQYLHEHFVEVMIQLDATNSTLEELEESVIGFGHEKLAHAIMENWNLPDEFGASVAFHHHPARAPRGHRDLVAVLYLANTICNAIDFGFVESKRVDPDEFNFCLSILGFTKTDVEIILAAMPEEFDTARDMIELADSD